MQRATRTAAQRIGDAGEALIASRLEAAGWTILARNVRVGRDELDLVAIDPGPPRALVVVEVRRPGIDRNEVQLVAADPHIASQDRPAGRLQPARDQRLARVTDPLRRGAPRSLHPRHPAAARSPGDQPALTRWA